jgi:hypothetical protein
MDVLILIGMKLHVCENCRHKLFSIVYAPKFCRFCRHQEFKSYSLTEWIISPLSSRLSYWRLLDDMKLHLLIILVLTCSFAACSNQAENLNVNVNKQITPTPSPIISDAERKRSEELSKKEFQDSINTFLSKNYKGWQFKAISDPYGECEDSSGYSERPCDLLISNGNQEKVITVKIKRFKFTDGTEKLIVYEPKAIDIVKAKIKESILENLTPDEISDSVRDEIIEGARE